jgi:hypothetical protein
MKEPPLPLPLWGNFSYEKTSKTSEFRDLLIYSHVGLSIPPGRTNRDVVEEIAKASHIPVESLPDELNQPVDPGSQVIWGYAGNEFDRIADNYNNMEWWVSDAGLNMAVVTPASPTPHIPTFDELMRDIYDAPSSVMPASMNIQARVPLRNELRNAETRTADPKLQKKLTAVVRYTRYLDDLKVLKTACKRYQNPALLRQQFPDLDVWAALEDDDKAEIAKGDFQPGIFAWSLVKRIIGLSGQHNRTLKNYRHALRKAKLL